MGQIVALNIAENFVSEVCCNCGTLFALSATMEQELRRNHETFYCPAGHPQHYAVKSREQILRAKVAEQEQSIAYLEREEAHRTRQLAATRGVNTKIRKRISVGVCPCCNRSFQDIKRHMTAKHPDYGKD